MLSIEKLRDMCPPRPPMISVKDIPTWNEMGPHVVNSLLVAKAAKDREDAKDGSTEFSSAGDHAGPAETGKVAPVPVTSNPNFALFPANMDSSWLAHDNYACEYFPFAEQLPKIPIESSAVTSTTPKDTPIVDVNVEINKRVGLLKYDITCIDIGAIVAAGNPALAGCTSPGHCIDAAIFLHAGEKLFEECAQLNGCETGDAKISLAYDLPCQRVIHTVGPKLAVDPFGRALMRRSQAPELEKCYIRTLEVAMENNVRSVALCCVSCGVYAFPQEPAARIAIQAVRRFLEDPKHLAAFDSVLFCTFARRDAEIYRRLMPRWFPLPAADIEAAAAASATSAASADAGKKDEKDEKDSEGASSDMSGSGSTDTSSSSTSAASSSSSSSSSDAASSSTGSHSSLLG